MQTVNDVRQAIICATHCKEVDFCTRDCLEYWLYQNPKTLKEFFTDYHDENIELPGLMLIEQMEFFAADRSNLVFRESLSVLDIDCTYVARFAVYAHDPQEIRIRAGSHLKGVKKLCPQKWKLDTGVNQLEIYFRLSSNYGYKSAKRKEEHSQLPAPAFKLGPLNIVSKRNITVSTTVRKNYRIPSQDSLLRQMQQYFASSRKDTGVRLFYVSGQSGVGKSYVLDEFIESASKSSTLLFVCGDVFCQHNAFRAPGAPSKDLFAQQPMKVDYFKEIYSHMHRYIFAHGYNLEEENLSELQTLDFVFLALDSGPNKREIVDFLSKNHISFVDTGIDVRKTPKSLIGIVRATRSVNGNLHAIEENVSFEQADKDLYASNIQVADLNAMAALRAIIQWKHHAHFYSDSAGSENAIFSTDIGEVS